MYYLESGLEKHNHLRNAIIAALAIHAVVILSVTFTGGSEQNYAPQIEVTLATRSTTTAPDEARHVAASNQQGSGDQAPESQLTSALAQRPPNPSPSQASAQQQAALDAASTRELITTNTAALRNVDSNEPGEQAPRELTGINPTVDALTEQLASLEAELDLQTRMTAEQPRVRRITSVSARQAVDAAYLLDWRRRLEAVGNKYYPEASLRYGLYGDVRLLVVIRQNGSLEDARVLTSSGYAVLDEAALKIVRMAAPYAPFPAELKATTDKLEIIRTWQFQENQLSSQ
tara:strand:+ start:84438 stop:85301 length:864 start_codon:yes stop_codon:yes gene_type:complete